MPQKSNAVTVKNELCFKNNIENMQGILGCRKLLYTTKKAKEKGTLNN